MSSIEATKKHMERVRETLEFLAMALEERGLSHDASKLNSPEKEIFDKVTPKLKNLTYGSEEYKEQLKEMGVALEHHYKNNKHHPEHYENGINGMTLIDLIEMFSDWCAAMKRHKDGSFESSMQENKKRFKMSSQLVQIFFNTFKEYKDIVA